MSFAIKTNTQGKVDFLRNIYGNIVYYPNLEMARKFAAIHIFAVEIIDRTNNEIHPIEPKPKENDFSFFENFLSMGGLVR